MLYRLGSTMVLGTVPDKNLRWHHYARYRVYYWSYVRVPRVQTKATQNGYLGGFFRNRRPDQPHPSWIVWPKIW
jgi:hypothetical protein